MKVLKFGGTSVGTAQGLAHVRHIVETSAQGADTTIIVVSALSGITDQLIATAQTAARGDESYRDSVAAMKLRHHQIIRQVIAPEQQPPLSEHIDRLFYELSSILHGAYLIQELTPKTADTIVAYGERLSSLICTALIAGATHLDARCFIKTRQEGAKQVVDFEQTNALIRKTFEGVRGIAVTGGFIATDSQSGVTTNLGRGGSDYTAALIAAALDAEALEIWTDVDGFLTADPTEVPAAYTIPSLSYAEATELCNFGAKVVYPPTIFPVRAKNIPIYVKNTFNPEGHGSVICQDAPASRSLIRGISSVGDTSMVTVSGMSMVGVIGVNRRIFGTLTNADISVFMVAQTSSETSTTLCLSPQDALRACQELDQEFAKEIKDGAMYPARLQQGMATVAAVGESMNHVPGIMGRLFTIMGRNGINVHAAAVSALETNISLVVEKSQLRKSMNLLHDSFFLSPHQDINVFLCGTGTVGSSLLRQIESQREALLRNRALKVNVVGIANSRTAIYNPEGLQLKGYEAALAQSASPGGIDTMVRQIKEMNLYNSVFVDCTASAEVSCHYAQLLSNNVAVVAANKTAASSDYEHYAALKRTARQRSVKFLFETNVAAGLPVIGTINDLRASGDHILRIEAVLSGTLNFIFSTLSSQTTLSQAVRMAVEQGYSEPDPRIDLSGTDVVRKITILARESGYMLNTSDIEVNTFLPPELFQGTLEDFWLELPKLDAQFEERRKALEQFGRRWCYAARFEEGRGTVGLIEITHHHPFARLEGSNNMVLLTTERYRQHPMLIQGYGAGADVTAAGVFADIMRAVGA